jgi:hypothetical protein
VSRSRRPARPKTWVDGRSIAGIAGSNPARAWMSVSCVCYVLPGRGLRDGPITCPEGCYWECVRVCARAACVCVCVSFSVIRCQNSPLQIQWAGRRDQTDNERKKGKHSHISYAYALNLCT